MISYHNVNQHNKRNFEDDFKQATKVGKWWREIEVDKNNFLQRLCRSLRRNVLQCENSYSSILLRKETSFVYYTSSVLRKSRHMKQKEKITHCC